MVILTNLNNFHSSKLEAGENVTYNLEAKGSSLWIFTDREGHGIWWRGAGRSGVTGAFIGEDRFEITAHTME